MYDENDASDFFERIHFIYGCFNDAESRIYHDVKRSMELYKERFGFTCRDRKIWNECIMKWKIPLDVADSMVDHDIVDKIIDCVSRRG